ncbi:hypothetical protein [Vibrio sp. TBV020]|uniref:hypothetical protein n=1 Tax=Vibrio sp. TBV020 TaxID=3137398 RepID=UPI0038CD1FF5
MDARIDTYRLTWNVVNSDGVIRLMFVDDDEFLEMTFKNASEFNAVVNILQNEDPVYFNRTEKLIYTGTSYVFQELMGVQEE